jgi:DNA repair exonuclease SbcCD ATPase subunit
MYKRSEAWTDPDGIFHHEHNYYGEPLHKKQQDLASAMELKDYQLSRLLSNKSRKLNDLHKKVLLEQINHQMLQWSGQPLMKLEELDELLWKDLNDPEELTIADEISKTVESKLQELQELEENLNHYVERGFDRVVHRQSGMEDALAKFANIIKNQQRVIDKSMKQLNEQTELIRRLVERWNPEVLDDESDAA